MADSAQTPRTASVRGDRVALAILVAALVVRLGILAFVGSLDLAIDDERQYREIALNILHGNGFAISDQLTSLRPPLYPAFLAFVWWLVGGEHHLPVRVIQGILSLGICVLGYTISRRLFDRTAARMTLVGLAFYPSLLFANMLLLSEVLFTFLLMAFVVCYLLTIDRGRWQLGLLTGAVLALAALTRSVLWPFPVVLVPLAVWAVRGTVRSKLLIAGALLAGYAAVIAPWAVRNTRLQGTLTVVDTMGGMNLRMGNYEHTPHDRMWDAVALTGDQNWSYDLQREKPPGVTLTEGQKEQWAKRQAVTFMLSHPGLTLRRSVIKFRDFWGLERELVAGIHRGLYQPPRLVAIGVMVSVVATYVAVVLLAIIGAIVVPPKNIHGHALLISLVLFVTGIHTIVFGHSRYHLPLVPILCVYAGAALSAWWSAQPVSRRSMLVPAVALNAAMVALWIHEVFYVDSDRIRQLWQVLL